ncbi:hypothetical protein B1756_10085 [Natrarchaeobaculum aegyptiacum]|uniref:Uncharacterized protein n=1 Tax=Natrarchaeobaculum aegyptiacum TaxID=745377 RepID=A0A2Z2HS72_9EURY|nr:hypothetical protein B1756_10085 [Natrarchaeobaculum aegyptiacum]
MKLGSELDTRVATADPDLNSDTGSRKTNESRFDPSRKVMRCISTSTRPTDRSALTGLELEVGRPLECEVTGGDDRTLSGT